MDEIFSFQQTRTRLIPRESVNNNNNNNNTNNNKLMIDMFLINRPESCLNLIMISRIDITRFKIYANKKRWPD